MRVRVEMYTCVLGGGGGVSGGVCGESGTSPILIKAKSKNKGPLIL